MEYTNQPGDHQLLQCRLLKDVLYKENNYRLLFRVASVENPTDVSLLIN
jgi:hypothetical protein